jgi:hypothetical protein
MFVHSSVSPDLGAEAPVAVTGWRRVGLLQRLVKTDAEAVSAEGTPRVVHPDRDQRRAA